MLQTQAIRPGVKFTDTALLSQPEQYRVHEIIDVEDDSFRACHLASNNTRTFPRTSEVLDNLEPIPSMPLTRNDWDCLVGEKVRLFLTDGGNVSGHVSAIIYHKLELDLVEHRIVSEIELDRSGATRYRLHEVTSVDRL